MSPSYQSKHNSIFQLELRIIGVILVAIIALGGPACSKLKNENKTESPGGGGHTSAAANNSNSNSGAPSPAAEGTPEPWEAKATSLNAKDGQTFTIACPPGGTAYSVWGSDIYTSDSSICTAGVHSGLITFQQGGTVTIEMRAGEPIYGCSERNGVKTSPYKSYPQSFVFKTPNTEAVTKEAETRTPVLWDTPAFMVSFEIGKTHTFICPPGGKEAAVWGTDVYTLDSSICNAAVHAGKLTSENGGPVTIELRPGEASYKGTTRNGIKTNDYEKYGESFIVK